MFRYTRALRASTALGQWQIDRQDAPSERPGEEPLGDVCWRGCDLIRAWMELERLLPAPETDEALEEVRAAVQADKERLISCFEALPDDFPGDWLPACTAWDDVVQGEADADLDEAYVAYETFNAFDGRELVMAGISALTKHRLPTEVQLDALADMSLWLSEHEEVLIPIMHGVASHLPYLRRDLVDTNPLLATSVVKFEMGERILQEVTRYEQTVLPKMAPEA
jgi:hypothetical protein